MVRLHSPQVSFKKRPALSERSESKGFAPIAAIIILAVVLVAGIMFVNRPDLKNQTGHEEFSRQSGNGNGLFGKCEGSGITKLATFPLEPKDIELIVPMGRVQDSHVTPTDHQYLIPKGTKGGSIVTDEPEKYQIKAPTDGFIVNVELFKEPVESAYRKDPYVNNYLVVFEYSCDFYTRLIHIDTLSDEVNSQVKFNDPNSQHPYANPRIKVREGEVIGTVGPHSFDFQIMDMTNPDKTILHPENIDPWTPVTVDTFDYLTDSLRNDLLPKNLRIREPLGGKVGYDKEGTLLGNWFRVGRDKKERNEYWTQNLSIVYDHIDESQIRVSFGDFGGYPKAYGVKGNTPDPKDVTKSSGTVKYELYRPDYHDSSGKVWDTISYVPGLVAKNTNEMAGVVLFELQNDGKLKVETFPGKSTDRVSGFTSKALIYER
ncbi:hypothetical protein HYZ78_03405 [Candidatus Microgenomates bacterium]|nr:hypothetical protein [Candidatus Microgenomates bacterium]